MDGRPAPDALNRLIKIFESFAWKHAKNPLFYVTNHGCERIEF